MFLFSPFHVFLYTLSIPTPLVSSFCTFSSFPFLHLYLSIMLMPVSEHYQDRCCSWRDREPGAKSRTLLTRTCPSICPLQHTNVSVNRIRWYLYHYAQLLIPVCSLDCSCCLDPVMLLSQGGGVCDLCSSLCSSTHIFTALPASTSACSH